MSKVRFGFADEIITPPDVSMIVQDGYGFRMSPAVGVHDDLHAKVMAVEGDGVLSLVFSVDLIGLNPVLYKLVTNQITAVTGIGREHISLVFTHTHAAPQAGILADMPICVDYFAYIGEKMGRAALRAMDRLSGGSFRFAVLDGELERIFNRRERPYINRKIKAAVFWDENGEMRAVLASAACHATINRRFEISADWLWELNNLSSDDIPYFYFQGAGADINPIADSENLDASLRENGRELTEPLQRFVRAEKSILGNTEANVCVRYEWLTVPMLELNDSEALTVRIRECEEKYLSLPYSREKHYALRELEWTREMLEIAESGKSFDLTVPMQMLTVGNAFAFAFVPFELLTLVGQRIEDVFVQRGYFAESVFVCGYSNSVNGYLAPPEEFEIGGYEVEGAAHWYKIPQTCPRTAPTVVAWFEKQLELLK